MMAVLSKDQASLAKITLMSCWNAPEISEPVKDTFIKKSPVYALCSILQFHEYEVLKDAGKISASIAKQ